MASVASRKDIALKAAKAHLYWKIDKANQYIIDCAKYVQERRAWEYQIFQVARKHFDQLDWPTMEDLSKVFSCYLFSSFHLKRFLHFCFPLIGYFYTSPVEPS